MESRAKLLGHPIHQMLIVFPLGLLGASVIFDILTLATGNPTWSGVAYWLIPAGLIGGLIAAPFGTWDWLAIPGGTRAKSVGALHGGGNVLVLLLFAIGWWMRASPPRLPSMTELALSFIGLGLALATGWLGGELVARLGVGVDDGANLNAPNSITTKKAA